MTNVKRRTLTNLHCSGCPEADSVRAVSGSGPAKAKLVIIGEHPGDAECVTGKPFTGPSGQLLFATLKYHDLQPPDCYFDNAIMCSSKPVRAHIRACSPDLFSRVRSRDPSIVLTLGKVAFQAVCETSVALADTDGTLWWQPKLNAWVIPTWHPAAVLRGGADDKFFPRIENAIWRVSRFIHGLDKLPVPGAKTRDYPWTLFRTPEGSTKALNYFLRKADESPGLLSFKIACDTESQSPGVGSPPPEIYIPESAKAGLNKKSGKGRPHPFSDRWIMLQLYDGERAAALDMTVQTPETLKLIKRLLRHRKVVWVGHNFAGYDTQVFRANLGIAPRDEAIRDTMVWGLGLSERANAVGLEPLARTWLNVPAYKKGLKDSGYRFAKGPQNEAQWTHLGEYGVDDVYNTYYLDEKLPQLVQDEGTADLCSNIILPLAITCGKLSARGFPINTQQIDKLETLWGARVEKIVGQLQELCARTDFPLEPDTGTEKSVYLSDNIKKAITKKGFNPRSHLQLAHLAIDVLGLAPTDGASNRKFSGTGKNLHSRDRAVDQDFLDAHNDTEFGQLMQQLRIYDKLVRTYVRGLVKEIDRDGLIHPDFNFAATATGRLVIKPLLQVLPHYGAHAQLEEEDFAKEVRRLFPARPGYVIVSCDFKQLEFRIAWMLSGDEALGRSLMSSDPHATTASMMFQKPLDVVTKADRHAAKRVGFGVAYNRSAFTLAKGPLLDILGGIEVPEQTRIREAQKFIDSYWASYPDYRRYFEWCMKTALETGELTTPFGRKRRWPLITHENKRGVENAAVNYPIQSTASDFCSTALIKLTAELPKRGYGYPLYTVHDEIVSEIKEDKLHEGIACIREIMSAPPIDTGGAVFPVDASYGYNLGDLMPYAA
jgi:uracil-DNA glycosylase family 4